MERPSGACDAIDRCQVSAPSCRACLSSYLFRGIGTFACVPRTRAVNSVANIPAVPCCQTCDRYDIIALDSNPYQSALAGLIFSA